MDQVCSIEHLERLGYYGHECKRKKKYLLIIKTKLTFQ